MNQRDGVATQSSRSVVVVDDFALNCEGLAAQFGPHGVAVECALEVRTLVTTVTSLRPVAILLNAGNRDSETLLRIALELQVPVIGYCLSADNEPQLVSWAEAGVAGLHLRTEPFDSLLDMVIGRASDCLMCSAKIAAVLLRHTTVLARDPMAAADLDALTKREREILGHIERGLTNRQIASLLFLTTHTVKNHVHSLLTKLGVSTRGEAARVARATRRLQQAERSLMRVQSDGDGVAESRRASVTT